MEIKNYKDLSIEEQFQFVTALTDFANITLPRLEASKDRMTADDRKAMAEGLKLIGAFHIYRSFAEQAFLYNDFEGRVYRLRHCVERIKKEIGKDVVAKTADGQTVAYIPALQQQFRRRGRPTREEAYAKSVAATVDDAESKRQQAIARLLDIEIVTNQTLREKNNDELAAEREQKRQEEAKANPSLFNPTPDPSRKERGGGQTGVAVATADATGTVATTIAPTIESLSETRLHLDQVRFLLSPELQQRVDTVRELRNRASVAAETAKTMALRGEKPEDIEVYTKQAAEATEQYEAIYDAVDNELGTVHYRLLNDGDYSDKFGKRFRIKDFTAILKQLRPYYDKVKSPEFEVRMKTLIEQESPEYVARMKAEKEKKEEVEGILRYLRRKDKQASKQRVDTARKRFARLEELLGKDMAKDYHTLLAVIEEEFAASQDGKAPVTTDKKSK